MTDRRRNLDWRTRHATHIPSIDAYHQGMFKVFRKLLQATRNGRMDASVGPILEFLEKYTRSHFAGEEAFMQQAGFPDVLAHLQEHSRFTTQLVLLKERFHQGEQGIEGELILLLSGWLSVHILEKDRTFADFIHCRTRI